MAKGSKATKKTFWVPMEWKMRGGSWIEAGSAEEAVEKAERMSCELHSAGAELIDWEVVGDAEKC